MYYLKMLHVQQKQKYICTLIKQKIFLFIVKFFFIFYFYGDLYTKALIAKLTFLIIDKITN